MKICPTCRQTYDDDSLNFCLNDGTVLNRINDGADQQTVFMGQANPTNNRLQNQTRPQSNNWGSAPPNNIPQQKKSKAWLWIVGIVGGVILLGIIGFIGLIAIALNFDDSNKNSVSNKTISNSNSANSRVNSGTQTDDFSSWRREVNDIGSSDYKDSEFIASSKLENYYYVLMTRNQNFITSDATTKVTVKNIDDKPARFGFGLVVKANTANSTRYAFLIETVKQSYRIVLHTNNKESTVVNWTKSSAIRGGTQANELKVKDENGKMTFFINGQSITTVTDSTGFKNGLAGIYTSGAVPIAFSNLEITR